MSESLKKVVEKFGYEIGYKKYKNDHPTYTKRLDKNIEKYGLKNGIDKTISENIEKYSNNKDRFIKLYGEELGNKKWEDFKAKIKERRPSLHNFIEKYGEEEGNKKWEEMRMKIKENRPSLRNFIEKYGEKDGRMLWENYKESLSFTEEKCIEKYGEEIGKKKWENYIKKMSESCKNSTSSEQMKYINSIDFYIEKYGEEEGRKKFNEWKKSQDHSSKEFMIKKYGIKEGLKKYKEVGLKRSFHSDSYHSKISQQLFKTIKNIIGDDECKYSENGHELRLFDDDENKPYYFDFSYKDKIIEYNGDYWHANPEFYKSDYQFKNDVSASDIWEKDRKKRLLAEQRGYKVLTIWDSDYKKDRVSILEKCLEFLQD